MMSLRADLDKVTDGGGLKVLIQLVTTYFFFCKSMARDLVYSSAYIFFSDILRADDAVNNNMQTVAFAPFGIKTLWGAISDAVPCFGYHKRFYILWGLSFAIFCLLSLLLFFPQDRSREEIADIEVPLGAIVIFGWEYGQASIDSLTQARYTELMKETGSASIVSFVWGLIQSSGLASAWGNLLLPAEGENDFTNNKILMWLALPLCLPMIMPAALNWVFEKPAKSFCSCEIQKLTQYGGIFALSMVLAFGSLTSVVSLLFKAPNIFKIIWNFSVTLVFVAMSYIYLPSAIPSPALYMYLCSAMRLYFFASLQSWYTSTNVGQATDCMAAWSNSSDLESDWNWSNTKFTADNCYCFKDGPGFTNGYYQLVGNLVGAAAGLTGVAIFERFIITWNVRAAFWVTTVFQVFACGLELIILQRANHSIFGTDPVEDAGNWVDQLFFVVGAQAVEKIVEMLDFMPCNVLIGKLCPPNLEATIFAILAGSQNFGSTLARIFGAIFVKDIAMVKMQSDKAPGPDGKNWTMWECRNEDVGWFFNLRGLAVARVFGGMILPALTIPLTFVLLPDRGLNDNYFESGDGGTELVEEGGAENFNNQRPVSIASLSRGDSRISAQSYISLTQRGIVPNQVL